MVGSAMVTITPTDNGMLRITIFNIMSLTSGDYAKDFAEGTSEYPISIMRNPNQRTPFGNISQAFHLLIQDPNN